jgi:transketolase
MMEGVSHESCALAGTLGPGQADRGLRRQRHSIDSDKGSIKQWYTDDVRRRFESYGWQVIHSVDGHDVDAVDRALRKAKRERAGRR